MCASVEQAGGRGRGNRKYMYTLYLDERFREVLEELQQIYPKLSKNDIARLAIYRFYLAVKAAKEGRDPCRELLPV